MTASMSIQVGGEQTETSLGQNTNIGLYRDSDLLFLNNTEIIPDGTAVIAHFSLDEHFEPKATPTEGRFSAVPDWTYDPDNPARREFEWRPVHEPTYGLMFDARDRAAGLLHWQLSQATDRGREVVQLDVSNMGTINARWDRYDGQGVLRDAKLLEATDALGVADFISGLIHSREINRQLTALHNRRADAEAEMAAFAIRGTAVAEAQGKDYQYRRTIKLSDDSIKAGIKQREEKIRQMMLVPFRPNNLKLPELPIDESEPAQETLIFAE